MQRVSLVHALIAATLLASATGGAALAPVSLPDDPLLAPDAEATGPADRTATPLIRVWDEAVAEQMAQPVPEIETGIGPGSALRIDHEGESGSFLCTANFVWTDDFGRLYLGTAGHCLLPEGKTATHGSGADHDPADTRVQVRTGACPVSGLGTACGVGGSGDPWVELAEVTYAIHTQVGTDFGLVRIPIDLGDQVRHEMPAWGGPTTEGTLGTGDSVLHYGQGLVYGEAFASRPRAGLGQGGGDYWTALGISNVGDSGSGVVTGASGAGALEGEAAIGILTHGIGAVVGVPGVFYGTHVDTAKSLVANQLGLRVWTLPGGAPLERLQEPANGNTTNTLPAGTVVVNHQHNETTTTTVDYYWPNEWNSTRILTSTDTDEGQSRITIRDADNQTLYQVLLQEERMDEFILEGAPRNEWHLRFEYENHTGSVSLRIEAAPGSGMGPNNTQQGARDDDGSGADTAPKTLPVPAGLVLIALAGLAMLIRRRRPHPRGS